MNEKILAYLKKLAETQTNITSEDFDRTFGDNYDNAYRVGTDDGEIWLARKILTDLNIPYNKK